MSTMRPGTLTLSKYFELARERYRIYLNRLAGLPAPWSTDEVYNQYRFCNTHRELDRTTQWFAHNVRGLQQMDPEKSLLNTIIFRWFNRISTGKLLLNAGMFDQWDPAKAREVLAGVSPVVTGAYVIKTPNGMNKLDGVIQCIETIRPHVDRIAQNWVANKTPLEAACMQLTTFPYLGGFMAHQLVADLKYTRALSHASDRFTWAYPGPGTTRGVSRMIYGNPDELSRNSHSDRRYILQVMRDVQIQSMNPERWPAHWMPWEMSDISNWFCESDKYLRVTVDGERMKQKYNPGQ